MSARKLILLVGLPRSGKSTWAREQKGAAIVNPDAIRLALHGERFNAKMETWVWGYAYMMTEALFLAGHEVVIVDATNVSMKRRDEWRIRFPEVETEMKIFDTSPAVCKQRAIATGQPDLLPVIDRMAAQWDLPKPESWDKVA